MKSLWFWLDKISNYLPSTNHIIVLDIFFHLKIKCKNFHTILLKNVKIIAIFFCKLFSPTKSMFYHSKFYRQPIYQRKKLSRR